MGIVKSILKLLLGENIIAEKEKISEGAYRIQLKSNSIKDADFEAGNFLRVAVGAGEANNSRQDFVRSYSVWNIDKTKGAIDIAVATHSNGAGAKWATQCKVGDTVYFKWKKGKFVVDNSADSYLLIGDLSALSHLYIINRYLKNDKQVESIVYNHHKSDLYKDIDGTTPLNFYEMPQNPTEAIVEKIKEIVPKMKGNKMVYIAGDSRVCIALNSYFRRELNWQTKQIKTKSFWNPDKKGLE
jgi:NADPH-dependent ferric siderophore reductase